MHGGLEDSERVAGHASRGRHRRRRAQRPGHEQAPVRPGRRARRARTWRRRELVANRALGFVHAPHPELAGPAPGSGLRRRRPGRFPDRRRDRRLRHPVRRGDRRAGPLGDDGGCGAWRRRRLRRGDRSGCLARSVRGAGERGVQHAVAAELRRGRADRRRSGQPAAVPQSRAASRRGRARRGGGGHGRAARRGDPCVRPPGDPVGGRARPRAAHLPRSRHPALDGGDRAARRALRRGPRDPPSSLGGLAAADRHTRASDARPEPAQRCRGRAARSARQRSRRRRAVLGRLAQPLRPRRPEARPAARRHRRLDRGPRAGRRRCRRAVRADPGQLAGSR